MVRPTDDVARALLGLPMAYVLPATEVLVAEAWKIIDTNLALAHELSAQGVGTAPIGSQIWSPIWERKGSRAAVRAVVLPGEYASRYFTGGGLVVLRKHSVRTLVAELMPWMAEDPGAAAVALEDTLELWTEDDEPLRPLESPYGGHYKLLSLMLADIARKADAGLDTLDWIASIGLPVEEFREDDDPQVEEIEMRVEVRMEAMWAQEDAWLEAAVR